MIITKEFRFDAAHKLPNYQGKCKNLHGHTYKLNVSVKGNVSKETGMVIDFSDVSKMVKDSVINLLDHSYLNDTIENPTAENITIWIWNRLKPHLNLEEIKLSETETSSVTYNGE